MDDGHRCAPGSDPTRTRRPPLTRLFAELNRRYFDGQLPRYRVIRVDFGDPLMDLVRRERRNRKRCGPRPWPRQTWADDDVVLWWQLGECDAATRCIRIDESLSAEAERRVLLHEMCHAATPGADHGPAFQRELTRLATYGEAWAAEEAIRWKEGGPP